MARAREWLQLCEREDEVCKGSPSSHRPKRLLNVLPLGDGNHVTLVETYAPEKYACLSYCWGKDLDGVLKTTKSNISKHYQGIPFGQLPKSIQDAVTVCRGVEISYLWADSLCIIQDDPQDWQSESSQMLEIYGRSHLTIYASASPSCKAGFLGRQRYGRSKWQSRPGLSIPKEFKQGGEHIMIRSGIPDRSRLTASTPADLGEGGRPDRSKSMAKSSLDERAWCFQEDILPNRRLYFDGNEMSWECGRRRMCECGHTLFMPLNTTSGHFLKEDFPFTELKQIVGIAKYENHAFYNHYGFFRDWKAIVEDYSRRHLTKSKDKLIAVSGLAAMMLRARSLNEEHPDTYLAGLFKSNFVLGLSWSAVWPSEENPEAKHPSKAVTFIAPSWSWASNNAAVDYESWMPQYQWKYKPRMVTRLTVDKVECNLVTVSNPTGAITSGSAILTGPLVSVQLRKLDPKLIQEWDAIGQIVWSDDDDEAEHPAQSVKKEAIDRCVALVRSRSLSTYRVTLDLKIRDELAHQDRSSMCWIEGQCINGSDCCTWCEDEVFYCLELFGWMDTDGMFRPGAENAYYHGIPPEVWFLVLKKSIGDGNFERVGVGECKAREVGMGEMEFWQRSETGLGGFENPLFAGAKTVTIKIV